MVPTSYGANGWAAYGEFGIRGGPVHLVHLYHASMSEEDRALATRVRDGSAEDWNDLPVVGDRGGGRTEYARFQYYDGKNPAWPVQALEADYAQVAEFIEAMERDTRTVQEIIDDNNWPPNPVIVKALVQTTMGTPATLYNGGILRASVRYFDDQEGRPGLPPNVAALVDDLSAERVGVQLVNTGHSETARVIVQSGAYGEHSFTDVRFDETAHSYDGVNPGLRVRAEKTVSSNSAVVNGKHFAVTLPPMTAIRLDCGVRRFVNDPSYSFPWHGEKPPIE